MGLPAETEAAVERIRRGFDVVRVSRAYPNRGDSRDVRVFMDVRLTETSSSNAAAPVTSATDRPSPQIRRVHNVLGWARTRIDALQAKRDKAPETHRAHRKECTARAEELQRLVDELDKALSSTAVETDAQ